MSDFGDELAKSMKSKLDYAKNQLLRKFLQELFGSYKQQKEAQGADPSIKEQTQDSNRTDRSSEDRSDKDLSENQPSQDDVKLDKTVEIPTVGTMEDSLIKVTFENQELAAAAKEMLTENKAIFFADAEQSIYITASELSKQIDFTGADKELVQDEISKYNQQLKKEEQEAQREDLEKEKQPEKEHEKTDKTKESPDREELNSERDNPDKTIDKDTLSQEESWKDAMTEKVKEATDELKQNPTDYNKFLSALKDRGVKLGMSQGQGKPEFMFSFDEKSEFGKDSFKNIKASTLEKNMPGLKVPSPATFAKDAMFNKYTKEEIMKNISEAQEALRSHGSKSIEIEQEITFNGMPQDPHFTAER